MNADEYYNKKYRAACKKTEQRNGVKIDVFFKDGFSLLCSVKPNTYGFSDSPWIPEPMVTTLMFSNHKSWIYMIVCNGYVVKIGECGTVLATKCSTGPWKGDPKSGTCFGRIGRLLRHAGESGDTDVRIRRALHEDAEKGNVQIFVKKCVVINGYTEIAGVKTKIAPKSHKEQEGLYLNKFIDLAGRLPAENPVKA